MATMKRYRVVAPKDWPADQPPFGLEYTVGAETRRVEAGEIATDLPAHAIGQCSDKCPIGKETRGWLLTQGLIEEVS